MIETGVETSRAVDRDTSPRSEAGPATTTEAVRYAIDGGKPCGVKWGRKSRSRGQRFA
jgi:hypothetical protein